MELDGREVFTGRVLRDDIETLWADEVTRDLGALTASAMARVEDGLRAALTCEAGSPRAGVLQFTPTGTIDPTMPILMAAIASGPAGSHPPSPTRPCAAAPKPTARRPHPRPQRTGGLITSLALLLVWWAARPLRRLYARYGAKEGFPGPRPDVALSYGRSGQ